MKMPGSFRMISSALKIRWIAIGGRRWDNLCGISE